MRPGCRLAYTVMNDYAIFVTITWSCLFLSFLASSVRSLFQKTFFSQPYDELFSKIAFSLFLANCAVDTAFAIMYFDILLHFPKDYRRLPPSFFTLQYCSTVLNAACLLLLKVSILTSYRHLIDSVRSLRRAWSLMMWTLIITFPCSLVGFVFPSQRCTSGNQHLTILPITSLIIFPGCTAYQFSYVALWIACIWDTATNIVLIALPLTILLGAKLSWKIKMSAALRFSLTAVVIVVSVIRASMSHAWEEAAGIFWLHLLGTAQCSICSIIVDCLAIRALHRKFYVPTTSADHTPLPLGSWIKHHFKLLPRSPGLYSEPVAMGPLSEKSSIWRFARNSVSKRNRLYHI
jgi:hypothetical protein